MADKADTLHLKIITPKKITTDAYVKAVTVPSAEGEITILPHHAKLFSQLKEGVLKIQGDKGEELLAIGGGFLETDGEELNILVSRAYGQNEIDENQAQRAIKEAEKVLSETKDEDERHAAAALLRRSLVDLKLLRKRKRPQSVS